VIARHVLFLGFRILDTCLGKGCGDHIGGEEEGRLFDPGGPRFGTACPLLMSCFCYGTSKKQISIHTQVGTCARAVLPCFPNAIVPFSFLIFFF